jgi:hypothetical protein
MITALPVLTGEQNEEVRAAVHDLRDHWIPRGEEPASFFTLGTASYLDIGRGPQAGPYQERIIAARRLLRARFGWLYELVGEALEKHLQADVRYPDHLALPGFHIWLEGSISTKPRASIHFDLQYQLHDWPPGTDTDRQLSFTLPVRLPQAGGGLNMWDVTYQQCQQAMERRWIETAADLQRFYPRRYVPYTPGLLFVHDGCLLHQVAPSSRVEPGDERLTLQGHGAWCDGRWLLYW